ncbi:MAG: hypothetical protein E6Y10_02325 [Anaerococcus sp.]|nr:hypothetical protein [Anaerococcus sp.]
MARTMYRKSSLLLFDEPSSSLDIISEKIIFDNILNKCPLYSKNIVSHIARRITNINSFLITKVFITNLFIKYVSTNV